MTFESVLFLSNNMVGQSAINIDLSKKTFFLMGIVNITPDSFSDGGEHYSTEAAVMHAEKLIEQGADILDFGGASSRPGAHLVSPDEEIKRVIGAIEIIASRYKIPISIDTTWVEVAKAALDAGATWVNDISAGRFDRSMAAFVAKKKCPIVLMHSRKTPQDMQQSVHYDNLLSEVKGELLLSVQMFKDAGVDDSQILLDPGIGFAKTAEQNISLLHNIEDLVKIGYPVVVGTSRKNFIGRITGKEAKNRVFGSLGSIASAFLKGAKIFRVHDVDATRDFLSVLSAIENPETVKLL